MKKVFFFIYAGLYFMSLPQNLHLNIEIWVTNMEMLKMKTYNKIKMFEDVAW